MHSPPPERPAKPARLLGVKVFPSESSVLPLLSFAEANMADSLAAVSFRFFCASPWSPLLLGLDMSCGSLWLELAGGWRLLEAGGVSV
jgi:hypothetical protein